MTSAANVAHMRETRYACIQNFGPWSWREDATWKT